MKYLVFGYNAIKSIVSHRKLQSMEYAECAEFVDFITGKKENLKLWDLRMEQKDDGGTIVSKKNEFEKGLVIDLTTFKGFNEKKYQRNEILIILQKVLRFCIRNLENQPYSSSEKNVDGNLSILFPFSTSTHEGYKIAIDRKPDEKRMTAKKGGNFLLVYADGVNGAKFTPPSSYSNFKKAHKALNSNYGAPLSIEDNRKIEAISVVNLDSNQNLSIDASIGFDAWKNYLTVNQKAFVESEICGPERLEGAAGTGKTLTLILRAINLIHKKIKSRESLNILFVTHSVSSKNQINNIFKANFPGISDYFDRAHSEISIEITTLQELSLNQLGAGIGPTEYLDRDAQDSKDYQLMIIEEALDKVMSEDFKSYKEFCSSTFTEFMESVSKEELLEMLQQEIAVSIKGRANEDLDKYKELPRFKYSIPIKCDGDLNLLFLIYRKYQDKLSSTGQFDSDDIILTTLGKLNTPIWRRRKELEGYDVTFVDETHLFNFNELAVFHYLNKSGGKNNIIFAVDKSQAVGDKGLTDNVLYDSLGIIDDGKRKNSVTYKTVFRSSPDIVNLAFEVLSSGTTLFTNFENPLDKAEFSFTAEEEKKSTPPRYIFKENDHQIIKEAFIQADTICKTLNTKKSKLLIVATSAGLLSSLQTYANKQNKAFELLKNRGDAEIIKTADKNNRYVIGGIDYVGGLEFDGVIIVGADKNRVPPLVSEEYLGSHHFLNYAWHNRMYVAITRAKYSLILIGDKTSGQSKLFDSAIKKGILRID